GEADGQGEALHAPRVTLLEAAHDRVVPGIDFLRYPAQFLRQRDGGLQLVRERRECLLQSPQCLGRLAARLVFQMEQRLLDRIGQRVERFARRAERRGAQVAERQVAVFQV